MGHLRIVDRVGCRRVTGGAQMWKGGLGGVIGGLFGGVLLESVRDWLLQPLYGKAAGLALIGSSHRRFYRHDRFCSLKSLDRGHKRKT